MALSAACLFASCDCLRDGHHRMAIANAFTAGFMASAALKEMLP